MTLFPYFGDRVLLYKNIDHINKNNSFSILLFIMFIFVKNKKPNKLAY